jgi:hypothetical protein
VNTPYPIAASRADPTLDSAEDCAHCGEAAERTARHLRMLAQLAEVGMDLALALRRRVMDPQAPEPVGGDVALSFSRIARAVRQTVALETRLAENGQARDRQVQAEQARALGDRGLRGALRKEEVRDIVDRPIEAGFPETDVERLLSDLDERLEDDRDDADFIDRPIGELVERICRDLGVIFDPDLLEDDDRPPPANGNPGLFQGRSVIWADPVPVSRDEPGEPSAGP